MSLAELYSPLRKAGKKVFTVGGALEAGELDAKRAIDQGTRLAAVIEKANPGDVFNAPIGFLPKIMKQMRSFVGK